MRYSKHGFTLIELIIVIVIIGVLASIAAPMMQGVKAKAICAEVVTALGTVRNAVRQYYVEYGAFPGGLDNGDSLDCSGVWYPLSAAGLNIHDLTGQYGSEYVYRICVYVSNGVAGWVKYYPIDAVWNTALKKEEARRILDPANIGGVYLWMDMANGKMYQKGIPQSGYPEMEAPPLP